MKTTIDAKTLSNGLDAFFKLIKSRLEIPALERVKLTVGCEGLNIDGTDLDVYLSVNLAATYDLSGCVAIDYKSLRKIIKKFSGDITLISEGGDLVVSQGKRQVKLKGIDVSEFPSHPEPFKIKDNNRLVYNSDSVALLDSFKRLHHNISTDETRYNICGVYIDTQDGVMVATDGHRLGIQELQAIRTYDDQEGLIIPTVAVDTMLASKKVIPDHVHSYRCDGWYSVSGRDYDLTVRCVDGRYPDYTQVIPGQSMTTTRLSGDELRETVAWLSDITTDLRGAVQLDVNGSFDLSSSSPELGESKASLVHDKFGDDLSIRLSAKYLAAYLKTAPKGDTVRFRFNGKLAPAVIDSEAVKGYRQIIMPMRFE